MGRFNEEIYEEVLTEFETDKYGIITDPGKFEGEPLYVPYYYLAMEGWADSETWYRKGPVFVFKVSDEERKAFAPFLKDKEIVRVFESEQGFVRMLWF